MQIIYLRMMLLSIDKGGFIYYQGVYDTIEEELAEEFSEDVELIQETLKYLSENNMVTLNENSDCFCLRLWSILEAKVTARNGCEE